ncbi:hypothetical protein [Cytophaga aurantiaca]|uniref:hypothetical protein n=1 Tax=Cytophaga aurantiaca TaxID=29530 RepID=UPI0012F9ECBF|nr:hypothetical protein [Cytophaga aurantiaca]
MKRLFTSIVVVCSLLTGSTAFAQLNKNAGQDAGTNEGDVLFDIGVGFGGGAYDGFDYYNYSDGNGYGNHWNSGYTNQIQIPTLSLTLQKAVWADITIGGQIAFNTFGAERDYHQNDDYYQHSKFFQTNSFLLGRGEFHFNRLIGWDRKFDLYAGLVAGVRISTEKQSEVYEGWGTQGQSGSWRNDYPDRTYTNIGPTAGPFGGFRFYWSNSMGVFAEVGWVATNLRTGLVWRL